MESLFSIMAVPLAVALTIPRLWLLPCTLLVVQAFAGLWINEQRMQCASCGGPFSGLGLIFLAIAMTGFIIGIAIRAVIAFFKPAAKIAPREARAANLMTWMLFSATLAVLATGLSVVLLNKMLDSGWGTHLGICLLAVAWFFLTPLIWRKDGSAKQALSLLHPGGVFKWVGMLTMFSLLAWSVRSIPVVQEAAELAAADRPYCINTSAENGLRPARTFWDLSGFSMQADRGSLRHAALVTGDIRSPEWLYWSYRRGAFEPDFMGWPVTCEPQPGFAKKLPLMPPAQSVDGGTSFWLAGGQWHIPVEYRGAAGDRPPILSFHAQGRDFRPLPASAPNLGYDMEMINSQVQVTLCDLETLHVWQARNDTNHKIEPAGTEAGLEKQSVDSRGSPHREFQYLGRDKTGRVSTWLLCHQGGSTCRHAFRRNGIVVQFQHPLSQFSDWKPMQDALWERVKSFALVWPEAELPSCKS